MKLFVNGLNGIRLQISKRQQTLPEIHRRLSNVLIYSLFTFQIVLVNNTLRLLFNKYLKMHSVIQNVSTAFKILDLCLLIYNESKEQKKNCPNFHFQLRHTSLSLVQFITLKYYLLLTYGTYRCHSQSNIFFDKNNCIIIIIFVHNVNYFEGL